MRSMDPATSSHQVQALRPTVTTSIRHGHQVQALRPTVTTSINGVTPSRALGGMRLFYLTFHTHKGTRGGGGGGGGGGGRGAAPRGW
jgi:hypothetical protein